MPRRVYDKNSGKMVWVGDDGKPLVNYNPGMGSLPGQALRREADLLSRLPDAQLAGFRGPSVVDPQPMRGARPMDPDPVPPHTYRPLAGAKQNARGNLRVVELPVTPGGGAVVNLQVPSLVETPRQAGDDAEGIMVVCGIEASTPPSSQFGYNIGGIVELGIGGANFSAEFDWVQGTTFVIPGSFVRVKADIEYFNETGVLQNLLVGAALSYGSAHGGVFSPLRKTINLGSIAPTAQSGFIELPNFATALTLSAVSAGPPLPPNLQINFIGTNGQQSSYAYTTNSNLGAQRDAEFPIPGWAAFFTVTNRALINFNVSAIFSLSL